MIGAKMSHMVRKFTMNIEMEVLLELRNEGLHLRALSKRLKVAHQTLSRLLDRLAEMDIVDYRFEGKNKVFFLKEGISSLAKVKASECYKLSKLLAIYPEMSVIIEGVLGRCTERLILIFGSYAKFRAKEDSDIDIFVETRDKSVKNRLEAVHSKVSVKIGSFDKGNLLIKEMMKDHIILRGIEEFYEKD